MLSLFTFRFDKKNQSTKVALRVWLFGCFFIYLSTLTFAQIRFHKLPELKSIPDSILTQPEIQIASPVRIPTELPNDSIPKYIRKSPLKSIRFNGYYRLFLYGRNMLEPYPNLAPYEKAYGVGDVYREPMLSFYVTGSPNGKTTFGTEFFFFTPYLGTANEGNVFTMNLGLNFYGNIRTDHGKFGVRAGGIHWHTQTPLTMGVFQAFDLYSIFDRTPWEGVTNTEKYDSYYESGSINRDTRWGNRAFQGIIVDGSSLPGKLSFSAFYGKTDNNAGLGTIRTDTQGNLIFGAAQNDPLSTIVNSGTAGNVPTYTGFSGSGRVIPSLATGGNLKKQIGVGDNFIAYNTLRSWSYVDSVAKDRFLFQVHTITANLNLSGVLIDLEAGVGGYQFLDFDRRWGEAINLNVRIPEEFTYIPISVQLYQFSTDFYNPNSEVQTFSNPEIQSGTLGRVQAGQASVGGALTQVGQLAHNRRGINLKTGIDLDPIPLKLNVGWGIAGELDTVTSQLSYVHRINGLALSRIYNPFPEGAIGPTVAGPYNRVFTFFRGAYEVATLTDRDALTNEPLNRKVFNAVDLQLKYRERLFGKNFYLFYLGTFMSAKSRATFLPTLDLDTYIFAQYHEIDIYYEIFPKFILTGYYGIESIKGGRFTEWGPTTAFPRDQIGTGIGIGADITVSENAGIYVRQRWMNFEDRNFELDHYRGHETTIELKVYF